jgi:putative cell wall-binding protein
MEMWILRGWGIFMRKLTQLILVAGILLSSILTYQSIAEAGQQTEWKTRSKKVELPKHKKDILEQRQKASFKSVPFDNKFLSDVKEKFKKTPIEEKKREPQKAPGYKSIYIDGVYYEEEPNDWFDIADYISLYSLVIGSISDMYNDDGFDDDFYYVNINTSGTLGLVGTFENVEINNGLVFHLYDQFGNFLTTSETVVDNEGNYFQYLETYVTPGIYFVDVWSLYSLEYYVEERYAFEMRIWDTDIKQTITRLSGGNRYETAVQISKNGWETGSNYAVITTGLNFPDALSATPLAKKYNAPLLLTDQYSLSNSLKNELIRLGVKEVFLVGGYGVLSPTLESKIKNLGIKTTRIAGRHRYETAINIAKHIGNHGEIVVATGENFADALSIAPIAAQLEMPIILVQKNNIPNVVNEYLKSNNILKTYVIGGTGVITNNVTNKFPSYERINGSDRYQTNSRIIDKFKGSINFNKLYVATGKKYPDALAGSALAAKNSAAMLLTDLTPSQYTKSVIRTHNGTISEYIILGGEMVIPYSTINQLFY